MDKTVRCTVCTWRGSIEEAAAAPRVRPSVIPPPMQEQQAAYEERQQDATLSGAPKAPPCPQCGHHLTDIHRRPPRSIHP